MRNGTAKAWSRAAGTAAARWPASGRPHGAVADAGGQAELAMAEPRRRDRRRPVRGVASRMPRVARLLREIRVLR